MYIDISHNQGQIDFTKVKASGVEGVLIKASQGSNYQDPMFLHNAQNAHNVGLLVGYYHFATLNNSNIVIDAQSEANWFISNVKKAPAPTLPVTLDIETNEAKLSKDQVLLWIKTFFAEIASLEYTNYMIYSYSYFFDSNLPISHGLGNIKLWAADYSTNLRLPKGWNKAYLWQYSQIGKINGISTNVDLSKLV